MDHFWLTTLNIRESTVPDKFFAYPSGYAAVAREAEVLNDNRRKKQMDDVIKDLLPTP